MSRHYPVQEDDLGCFALIAVLAMTLLLILTLARLATWALETLSGS